MEGGSYSVVIVGVVGIRARVVVGVAVVGVRIVGSVVVVAGDGCAGVLEVWFVVGSRDEGGAWFGFVGVFGGGFVVVGFVVVAAVIVVVVVVVSFFLG